MKILEIELLTDDLESTERFYSDVLELKLIDKIPDMLSFQAGRSILRFKESANSGSKYHFAFDIPHNKLEESIKWISPKVELIKNYEDEIITHFDSWNATSVYFYDNSRNILEFISRYDVKNASDKSFDSRSILSISEIGVVADKPLSLANELIEQENLDYFVKGPKWEDFVVLGDENGLIVISDPRRNWFPTHDRAEKHRVRMVLAMNGIAKQIEIL